MNANFITNKIVHLLVFASSLTSTGVVSTAFAHSTTPQTVEQYGYPVETHIVETVDGYLLELHRIPYGISGQSDGVDRYPVLLYHGLASSSYAWVLNGPNKSLGFRLADDGFDVWMGNMRGNVYSRGHVQLTQMQSKYWDFSFHEMGIADMPATIDYILNQTKHENLTIICHSLGNTVFYVMTSILPEYNDKVKAQISLAPVATIAHTTSVAIILANVFIEPITLLSNFLLKGSLVIPTYPILTNLLDRIIWNDFTVELIREFVMPLVYGRDPYQFDRKLIPIFFGLQTIGSAKTLHHGKQLVEPGRLAQYDYGESVNMQKYGTAYPPPYNISSIKVPVRIYYGDADSIVTSIDARAFYRRISNPMGLIRVKCDTFNHIDFIGAVDINPLLNDDVIQVLRNITRPVSPPSSANVTANDGGNSSWKTRSPKSNILLY